MATLALGTGGGELIANDDFTVTSARAENLKTFLPLIDDGAGATVASGFETYVVANSTGDVEIVDLFGVRVGVVQAGTASVFKASGSVTAPVWTVVPAASILSIGQAQPSAGSTTAALGTTSPAASATVKWIGPVQLLDGTVAYIPCWT